MAVLKHLDRLNLGFVPGREVRQRLDKYRRTLKVEQAPVQLASHKHLTPPKWSHEPVEWTPPPPPFGVVGSRYCSAAMWEDLPKNRAKTCEIAVAGRSNVGKSTLLNVLTGLRRRPQKRAAVSPTPGETKALEFYRIGRRAPLTLVDMPGYGFSFANDETVDRWSELMVNYLRHRNGLKGRTKGDSGDTDVSPLKRLLLLVDARHGLKAVDKEFLHVVYDRKGTATTALPANVKLPSTPPPAKGEGGRRAVRNQAVELVPPCELLPTSSMTEGLDAIDTSAIVQQQPDFRSKLPARRGDTKRSVTVGALAAAVADPPKLQVVLTKCDLVNRKDLVRRVMLLREDLRDLFPPGQSHYDWGRLPVVMLSSLEEKGVRELQRELASLATYKGGANSTK